MVTTPAWARGTYASRAGNSSLAARAARALVTAVFDMVGVLALVFSAPGRRFGVARV
jgi:hypothetical protein